MESSEVAEPAVTPAGRSFGLWAFVCVMLALGVEVAAIVLGQILAATSDGEFAGLAVVTVPLEAAPIAAALLIPAWVFIALGARRGEAGTARKFRVAALAPAAVMSVLAVFAMLALASLLFS